MTSTKKKKINFSYFAVISVNMMSVLAGIGYAWSSPCIPKLRGEVDSESNPLSHPATFEEISWITSLFSLGTIAGPLLTGILSTKLGKKKVLLLFAIPQLVSNIIMIFADRVELFYLARFLLGIGTGCVFSVIPIYVAEISETNHRGRTSIIFSIMFTLTQDFVYFIGPFITIKILAIISIIPSIIFFILFGIFVPESPYDYVYKNELIKAETALIKSRENDNVQEELQEIINLVNEKNTKFSFKALILSKAARKSAFLAITLMFFQQFNGINAIASYQQSIFNATNSIIPADKCVMIVASVQLIGVILVTKLIDRWGRKKLLIISYIGLLLSLLSLSIYFHLQSKHINTDAIFWLPLLALLIFMLSFKLGAGPVSWTVTGEIFPQNFKFILSPLVTFMMTLMSFLVTFVFPRFWSVFGLELLFWVFSGVVACAIPFIVFFVPETKGKTLLQIQELLEERVYIK